MNSHFSSATVPAITAMGCISPLGCDAAATRASLLSGYDGISDVRLFAVSSFQAKTAGQVPECFAGLVEALAPAARKWSRAAQLILMAVHEALEMRRDFKPEVIIAGTTGGGMDFGELFFRGCQQGMHSRDARAWVRSYMPHQPVLEVIQYFGYDAPIRVISNACASGTNALGIGAGLIRNKQARRVLVIGYDALVEMVFAGFDALRAATTEKCRPFDVDRSGLVLGEGAAAFFLEPLETTQDVLATIPGYGFANDNYHLTQPDPSGAGPRMSMQRALAHAGWMGKDVDYVNAHGTGTTFNDASEAAAILEVCPQAPVSSTKGMTGHSLGAAGAIEAAYCVHALQGAFLPPNIHFRQSDLGLDIIANSSRLVAPRRILSNSFGFGGSNATILLERWDG